MPDNKRGAGPEGSVSKVVDHHGAIYGHFEAESYQAVRGETSGDDIGGRWRAEALTRIEGQEASEGRQEF